MSLNFAAIAAICGLFARLSERNCSSCDCVYGAHWPPTRGYCDGTPLHNAAAASSVEAARLLLAHGADVNARDSAGRTPLIIAASNMGTDEMIQLLVESGADPSIVDSDHNTALDCANMESAEDAARIRSSVARATVVSDTRQVSRSSK